ncbi:MAG: phosphatidylglycerol lysyltransferase domain-containing protein [Ktedonobacterales bacterium]
MRESRRITAFFYGVGVVNIVSALLPIWPWRYAILANSLPLGVILGAQLAAVLLGVAMLLLAYPAAQRHRHAAYLLMACAALAVGANLFKGMDVEEAALNVALLVVLWRGRHRLESFPLRYTAVDLARLGLFLFVLGRMYSLTGSALIAGLHALMRQSQHAVPPLTAVIHVLTDKLEVQRIWFPESELVVPIFLLGLFVVLSWRSVLVSRLGRSGDDHPYDRFGRASHNSLAYLANRDDVNTFMDPAARGAITYRRFGRVALQVGAILGASADAAAIYAAFRAFCKRERLIPAAVALSAQERDAACACGMRSLPVGTEAVVDLAEFAVDRLSKKMRWAQRALRKRGYAVELLSASEIAAPLRVRLDRIDEEWRGSRGGEMHGFCMTLGRFPTNADPHCLIAVAHDAAAEPIAYLTLLPGGDGYYSLDLTRRLAAAPNATMEFLLLEVLEQLRQRGVSTVSLNFSACSSLPALPGGGALLRLLSRAFQLSTLEGFNSKFRPRWEPRYLVFPSWTALPDVLYAALTLEGVGRMALNAWRRSLRRQARRHIAPLPAPQLRAEGA